MKRILIVCLLMAGLIAQHVSADIPKTINYQGRLTDSTGNVLSDGTYSVAFRLWTHPTSTDEGTYRVWNDTYDVQTTGGYFSVELGSGTNTLNSLDFNATYYLDMKVGADTYMTPRQKLNSAAYAMNVADGAIKEAKISDNAVTTEKLANNAVTQIWSGLDNNIKTITTTDPYDLVSVSFTLSRTTAIMITGKVQAGCPQGDHAEIQFYLTEQGVGNLDYGAISLQGYANYAPVTLIATTILSAGSHTIKFFCNPTHISGASCSMDDMKLIVLGLYN